MNNLFRLHYYGDIVRKLLFIAAMLMLISLPFFNQRLHVSLPVSLGIIIAVGLFAGLTNPVRPVTVVFDMTASLIATITFSYYAVTDYQANAATDLLFWTDQALAIIFLFAFYYSTKTMRAMFLERPAGTA